MYPYQARRRNISGRVVVKFLVDSQGNVGNISVLEAKPKGIFEENAIAAIERWQFRPGYYRGEAVKTWVTVPITFELSDIQ
jgi:protein TonB